jgi:hypothetical protein
VGGERDRSRRRGSVVVTVLDSNEGSVLGDELVLGSQTDDLRLDGTG